jgi:hypothetical protein
VLAVKKLYDPGTDYNEPPGIVSQCPEHGRQARGTPHISLGHVTFVTITDGGSGYQKPVSVRIRRTACNNGSCPNLGSGLRIEFDGSRHDPSSRKPHWVTRRSMGAKIAPTITDGFGSPWSHAHASKDQACRPAGRPSYALPWRGVWSRRTRGMACGDHREGWRIGGFSVKPPNACTRYSVVVFANARETNVENGILRRPPSGGRQLAVRVVLGLKPRVVGWRRLKARLIPLRGIASARTHLDRLITRSSPGARDARESISRAAVAVRVSCREVSRLVHSRYRFAIASVIHYREAVIAYSNLPQYVIWWPARLKDVYHSPSLPPSFPFRSDI